jgi:hypothetical protein
VTVLNLPHPHSGYVDTAVRLFRQGSATPPAQSGVEAQPRVIVIDGERGSGKTTIMNALMSSLNTSDGIVLPTIQPEFFSDTDTVLGLTIAHLSRTIARDWPEVARSRVGESEDLTIITALGRLLRKAANVSARSDATEMAASSGDYRSEEFARSSVVSASFIDDWRVIMHAIQNAFISAGHASSQVVVAIDDPDLAPELLPRILLDLRILGNAPSMTVVTALNTHEVKRTLAEQYLRTFPILSRSAESDFVGSASMLTTVESQIAKALPRHATIAVRELTLEQRLNFRPIDGMERKALIELIRDVALPDIGFGPSNLGTYFQFEDGSSTPYSHVLPSSPRALSGLYYTLQNVVEANDQVLARAVELLAKSGMSAGPSVAGESLSSDDLVRFDWVTEAGHVNLNLSRIRVKQYVSDRFFESRSGGGTLGDYGVRVKPFGEIRGQFRTIGDAWVDFPKPAFYSMALVQDLVAVYDTPSGSITGHALLPGLTPMRSIDPSDGAHRTDGMILLQPNWDGFLDFFIANRAWGRFVELLVRDGEGLDARTVSAITCMEWWRIHASVQLNRSTVHIDSDLMNDVREIDSGQLAAYLKARLDDSLQLVGEAYRSSVRTNDARSRDFIVWFESYFLFACHTEILDAWIVERMVLARNAEVEGVRRRAIADERFLSAGRTRAEQSIGAYWVDSFMDVMARVLGPNAVDQLQRHNLARTKEDHRVTMDRGASNEVLFEAAMRELDRLENEQHPGHE